ncbi:MAG: anaerobic ribonucleoside-triphosphate reductase [Candidatus Woesearchaeota archaeon]
MKAENGKTLLTAFGDIGELSQEKIEGSLLKETSIGQEKAHAIAQESYEELVKMKVPKTTNLVREVVCIKLLENGLEKENKEYARLGMPVYDIKKTIFVKDKENANTNYNLDSIHKKLADSISSQYTLFYLLPPEVSKAHMTGQLHIHDLDYFPTRPFCFEHDIRFFLKEGFMSDGKGVHTAVSGPAKSLAVALIHAARILILSSTYFSGGQGYDSLNVFLAPYAKGLSFDELKQAIQAFVFELDQLDVVKGGQTPFTSASLEFNIPKYLKDIPVVLPGGKQTEKESYFDYQDESRRLIDAFTEVMMRGDYAGKSFHFPKPEYKIRNETLKDPSAEDTLAKVHKLVAKYGTPYFLNMAAPYMPEALQSQCCRYFLRPDGDFWDDIKTGTVRGGSIQSVTINLPNVAYQAGDESRIYEVIDQRLALCKKVFDVKRTCIKQVMESGNASFLTMDCYGKPYYKLDKSTNSVGFIGLNEMVKSLTGEELHETDSAWKLGLKIIKYLSDKIDEYKETTGERWGTVQTPAESAAYRLATLDLKNFGSKATVCGNVKEGDVYYTNSSHVNYGANIPLFTRLKIDSSFHPLVQGGAISHIWLGEADPDPGALLKLTKRICTQTLTSYFAYTKDTTYCHSCKRTFGGVFEKCPNCKASGDTISWYSRVTGYITPVKSWNKGKLQEFLDRKKYDIGKVS